MTFVQFFGDSYFLSWCALWALWIMVPVLGAILRLSNKFMYSVTVILRGHPPAPITICKCNEKEVE